MRQKTNEDVKSNASVRNKTIGRPRTRAYIKQENEDTKESLKCALYSPVKIEAPSLEISKYEISVKDKHCSICNITFRLVETFLDHELHSHKTKEIPVINLKTRCCNVCNKEFINVTLYRKHMADLNNIRVPSIRTTPDPSKTPDANDPNNYCMSCNFTFQRRSSYTQHLVNIHHMSRLRLSKLHYPKNMKPTIDILGLYCDTCTKTYDTKKSYILHLVKLHKMVLPNIYSEPGNFDPSSLYCKVCDIMYKEKYRFILHLRKIHPTALTARPDAIININDQKNYCVACDITLSSKENYLRHLSSMHLEEKPELYQGIYCKSPRKRDVVFKKYCADCHKVFLLRSLYYIHLNKIHGIKPLKYFPAADDPDVNHCTLCDKKFQNKDIYRRHIIGVHNMLIDRLTSRRHVTNRNETPVVDLLKKYCNVCDRVYKTLQSYQIHLSRYHRIKSDQTKSTSSRVNRNEIPAIDEIDTFCTACNKIFVNRTTYKVHLYSIHDITLPIPSRRAPQINRDIIPDTNDKKNHCASCDKTYSRRTSYKRHLATVHDMRERNIKQEDQNEKLNIRSVQTD